VPLFFINPGFGRGESTRRVSGHIDVAPTILDLLGMPAPTNWQGTSLFRPLGERPVYFFAPSKMSLGGRLGSEKFTTNLLQGTSEQYDLVNDPGETRNLAQASSKHTRLRREQLAAWARWSNSSWADVQPAKLTRSNPTPRRQSAMSKPGMMPH
jgi:arylsulfatase A-like enzyme